MRRPGVFTHSTPRAYVAPTAGMPDVLVAPSVTAGMPWRSAPVVSPALKKIAADGAGGSRVLDLYLERAEAALNQRDVAGGEADPVGGIAAAGVRVAEPELEVHGRDRRGDLTRVALRKVAPVDVLDVRHPGGGRLFASIPGPRTAEAR